MKKGHKKLINNIKKKPRGVVCTNLDYLVGSWSNEDYLEFHNRIEYFKRIDEKVRK